MIMKKLLFAWIAVILNIISFYPIYAEETEEIPKYSISKEDVTFTAHFDKLYYTKEDKEINLRVIVDNTSEKKIAVPVTDIMYTFSLKMTDEKGKEVPFTDTAKEKLKHRITYMWMTYSLNPKQKYEYKTDLRKIFVIEAEQEYKLELEGTFYLSSEDTTPQKYKISGIRLKIK